MNIVVNQTMPSAQSKIPFCNNSQAQRAIRWTKSNPKAWYYMVELAKQEASLQQKISMRWIIEEARKKSFDASGGEVIGISNSLSPALARLLITEVPEARPYIELRHSSVDDL